MLTDSPSPTMSTWSRVISVPTSAGICSIFNFSPLTTRYCLPPVFMTAYMLDSKELKSETKNRALYVFFLPSQRVCDVLMNPSLDATQVGA